MTNWLERAATEGTPLIDGEQVSFVWNGATPARLIGDFTGWFSGQGVLLIEAEPGVWLYQLPLPDDAYLEYGFEVSGERVLDQFNARLVDNGMDGKMNNWFRMPKAIQQPLSTPVPDVPRGTVSEHTIGGVFTLGTPQRTVYLYQPPVDKPVPLVVVLDGGEFLRRTSLNIIVDNLIAQKRIRPIALAMIDNGQQVRFVEYMCNDATIGTIIRSVIPLAQKHLNLIDIQDHPGAYGMFGASMGGLMSLYTALRVPEIFGHVISFSGAFGFDLNGHKTIIWEILEHFERRDLKLWMNVGRYEWLFKVNQEMRDFLHIKGYAPTYREYNGGHNYTVWGDEAAYALEAIFGP